MSATATMGPEMQLSEAQKKSVEMVFELVNRSQSLWVRKGDERSPNPRHLNSPKSLQLPITSRKYLGSGNGYAKIQYVPGANTHFVDDFVDGDGKIAKGLKSQGYDLDAERARAMNMNIHFLFGKLDLRKFGEDPVLIAFVRDHENNMESTANTLPGGRDPRKLQKFNFKPLKKEEKAAKAISTFDEDVEAMILVSSMRKKTAKGYEYNTLVLDAFCSIFEIGQGLSDEDSNQKMEPLIALAKRNGSGFLKAVEEVMTDYKQTIGLALKYQVISITSKEAKIAIGDQASSRELVGENQDAKMKNLAYYFIGNQQGRQEYSSVCGEVELKKAEQIRASK